MSEKYTNIHAILADSPEDPRANEVEVRQRCVDCIHCVDDIKDNFIIGFCKKYDEFLNEWELNDLDYYDCWNE